MAEIRNIVVEQGATHIEIFKVNVLTDNTLPENATTNPYIPLDLTGYTARLQVRKTFNSTTTVLDLISGGEISMAPSGSITITITPALTNALLIPDDKLVCYYDLLITGAGKSTRVVEGLFTIKRAITRTP